MDTFINLQEYILNDFCTVFSILSYAIGDTQKPFLKLTNEGPVGLLLSFFEAHNQVIFIPIGGMYSIRHCFAAKTQLAADSKKGLLRGCYG